MKQAIAMCPICHEKGKSVPLQCDPKRPGEALCCNCGWYNWKDVSEKYMKKKD